MIIPMLFVIAAPTASAAGGFSIGGGLLYDLPISKIYEEMEPGIGYIGSIGYDVVERVGVEIGVLRSTHRYGLGFYGGAVFEEEAEKSTIFIKLRAVPWKVEKAEFVLGVGPAFFDISGKRLSDTDQGSILDEDFSGWGFLTSIDFRYHISKGLAVTFYVSRGNVKYKNYTLYSVKTPYDGDLPRGDSVSWGITIFHRIGRPEFLE